MFLIESPPEDPIISLQEALLHFRDGNPSLWKRHIRCFATLHSTPFNQLSKSFSLIVSDSFPALPDTCMAKLIVHGWHGQFLATLHDEGHEIVIDFEHATPASTDSTLPEFHFQHGVRFRIAGPRKYGRETTTDMVAVMTIFEDRDPVPMQEI